MTGGKALKKSWNAKSIETQLKGIASKEKPKKNLAKMFG